MKETYKGDLYTLRGAYRRGLRKREREIERQWMRVGSVCVRVREGKRATEREQGKKVEKFMCRASPIFFLFHYYVSHSMFVCNSFCRVVGVHRIPCLELQVSFAEKSH